MKPRPPLRPTFVNERARIEEHDRFMAEARRKWPGQPICPDHYLPASHRCCPNPYERKR